MDILFLAIAGFCIAVIVFNIKKHGSFSKWQAHHEQEKIKAAEEKSLRKMSAKSAGARSDMRLVAASIESLQTWGHNLNVQINAATSAEKYSKLYSQLLEAFDQLIEYEHLGYIDWGGNPPSKNKALVISKKDELDREFIDRSYSRAKETLAQLSEERSRQALFDYFYDLRWLALSETNVEYVAQLEADASKILESKKLKHFDMMDGREFERFCAELLKNNGFSNVEVTTGSGDFGADVLATKDGVTYAIQCKRQSSNVGNAAVQEVFSGKAHYNTHLGVVMTNRFFTKSAKEQAKSSGVVLWDRDFIEQLATKTG